MNVIRHVFALRPSTSISNDSNGQILPWILSVISLQIVYSFAADFLIRCARSKMVIVVIDSLTHGIHAALCWTTVLILETSQDVHHGTVAIQSALRRPLALAEIGSAFCVGCGLDIDHFLAGASLSLTTATSLSARPFGHNLTFVFVLALFVGLLCLRNRRTAGRIRALVLTSCLSHLSRDAMKRGFNFMPFSETHSSQISRCQHILILSILPFVPLTFGFAALRLEPLFSRVSVSVGRLMFYSLACDPFYASSTGTGSSSSNGINNSTTSNSATNNNNNTSEKEMEVTSPFITTDTASSSSSSPSV